MVAIKKVINIGKLKKLGDKIINEHNYYFDNTGELDRNKINEAILKNVKSVPEAQRSFLSLYIESKIDCRVDKIEVKIDKILELAKKNAGHIKQIKSTVGCNGD